jgi:predicted NACHT family NTPase
MIDALSDFSKEYRKCAILLTCRVAANKYYFAGEFKYLEIANFTDEQIRNFVQKWFGKNEELGKKFIQDFEEHRGLRELANTDFTYFAMCVL